MNREPGKQTAAGETQIPAIKPARTRLGLKGIVTIVLLLFVGTSVVYLILGQSPVRGEKQGEDSETTALVAAALGSDATQPVGIVPNSESPDEVEEVQRRLIVYYFHGTTRCATCRAIEQNTYEALTTGFPGELESGRLEWRPVNVEESENQHFTDDYELVMRSVILADTAGEIQIRWKNLDRIWDLSDKGPFISYIQAEIKAYLEEN